MQRDAAQTFTPLPGSPPDPSRALRARVLQKDVLERDESDGSLGGAVTIVER